MNAPRRPLRILATVALSVCALSVLGPLSCGGEDEAPPESEFSLIYYDGHIHTSRSDGTGTVANVKETALARGLSAVIITDHCEDMTADEWESLVSEAAAASDASFLVIPAFENTGWESATALPMRDHFLAYNAPSPYVKDEVCISRQYPSAPNTAGTGPTNPDFLTKWVEWTHSQGGIAVHAHPAGTTQLDYGADLIEIWNQSNVSDVVKATTAMGYSETEAWELGVMFNNVAIYGERDLAVSVPFKADGAEELPFRDVFYRLTAETPPLYVGQWLGAPEAPLRSWDELLLDYVSGATSRPLFAVATTDAHNAGGPDSAVGSAKTGVYIKSLTADELYGAIMAGRSFATTGPSVGFDVSGGLMGETVHVTSGGSVELRLNVKAETEGFTVAGVRVIKNGEVWQTVEPLEDIYEETLKDEAVTEDGYYRVEVTSSDDAGNEQYAWSNPVFVKID